MADNHNNRLIAEDPPWAGSALGLVTRLRAEVAWFRSWAAENLENADDIEPIPDMTSNSIIVMLGSNLERVASLVNELDRVLERGGFEGEVAPLVEGEIWGFGTYDLPFERRPIYNGFLEHVARRPIVEKMTERVVAYLITIDGEDDLLEREKGGGVGWHYHYLNKWKQRSDVLLAWDTRSDAVHDKRGIFSEKHAARGKQFAARPGRWKDLKRETIHIACKKDFERWSTAEFRNASDNSSVVWPKDAVLTPRLSAPLRNAGAGSSKAVPRKRR